MDPWIIGGLALFGAYTLYLNILATLVTRHRPIFTPWQQRMQLLIVWLLPLIGALLILRLLFMDRPDTLPRAWVPWPFKRILYGPPIKRYNDAPPRRHIR